MKSLQSALVALIVTSSMLVGPVFAQEHTIFGNGVAAPAIVTPDSPSKPIQIAANDLLSLLSQRFDDDIPIAPVSQFDGSGSRTSIRLGTLSQLGIEADLPCDESLLIRTIRQNDQSVVYLSGQTDIAVMYAANKLLEMLGVRFLHPGQYYMPQSSTVSLPDIDLVESPAFTYRGFQQHTLHPIPFTTIFMEEPTPENLERSKEYVDWLAHNRQNYLYWWWVGRVDPTERVEYVNQIVDYAHERGVKVGIVVGMPFNNPQDSYNIMTCDVCHADRDTWTKCLKKGVDEMAGLGVDSICVFFGEGEGGSFKQPDGCEPVDGVEATIDRVEVMQNYVETEYPHMRILLWIHPTVSVRGNERSPIFFLLPELCPPSVGAAVHTVMFYNLFDPAPTAYGHSFEHLRKYTLREMGKRPLWYWPESAYACGFDLGVPQYWPAYLASRWSDAAFVANKCEGHITFTTGSEWLYWFNDYATAKFTWNPKEYTVADTIAEYADVFGPAASTVDRVMTDLTLANEYYFLRLPNTQNVNLMRFLSVGDFRRLFSGIGGYSIERIERIRDVDLHALAGLTERYERAYKQLESIDSDIPETSRAWFTELLDTIEITWIRCEHQLHAFEQTVGFLLDSKRGEQTTLPMVDRLETLRARAKEIYNRREPHFRYQPVRYRGPYTGYMRPFTEWAQVTQLVKQHLPIEHMYPDISRAIPAERSGFQVRKPVGRQFATTVTIPSDFPLDEKVYLVAKIYDTDSPEEGSVLVNGQRFEIIESGNGMTKDMFLELPDGLLKTGKNTIAFEFSDTVNNITSGYDVSAILIALRK